jgi:UPF0755 protein
LAGGVWYGFDKVQSFLLTPDYDGPGSGEVVVEIKAGENLSDIANTLVAADVVKSARAFIEAAEENPASQGIQPGFYRVRKQMSGEHALGVLLDLANRVSSKITIPEGRTAKQTFKVLSEATDIPVEEFEKAAEDPEALGVPDWWFTRNDGRKPTKSVEGFLFPDTYDFNPDATAQEILEQMVQTFLTVTGKMKFAERVQEERGGISPYEALIVASLAQAEAGTKEDLGKVARVAYNRVYSGTFPCSCLEMDVTVNYWLELSGQKTKTSGEMLESELLDESHPYSRKLKGLVATPINNPGREAMEGAMSPPEGSWLYFVAINKKGESAFTADYQEHLRNIQKAKEAGVLG